MFIKNIKLNYFANRNYFPLGGREGTSVGSSWEGIYEQNSKLKKEVFNVNRQS